jgi:transposase
MRGYVDRQVALFAEVNLEARVPQGHPLRRIKALADEALGRLSPVFANMYDRERGRESIPPERLLKAMILIALYSVRSERQFCEMLQFNLLWRWFLDMGLNEDAWDASTFSRNRERLLDHDVSRLFFEETVEIAKSKRLLSERHFTVDGSMIEAWASLKSFQPKEQAGRRRRKVHDDDDDPGNPMVNFRGERRSNETHVSQTDPEARLLRKGSGTTAKLCFMGNVLMENRNGLIVDLNVEQATGYAEREAALKLIDRARRRRRGRVLVETLGADKGYGVTDFIEQCRAREIRTHIPFQAGRKIPPGADARTTRHPGYAISQRIRKRVEEIFGWAKQIGGLRRTRFRGIRRTEAMAQMVGAAYNLLRIPKIEGAMA